MTNWLNNPTFFPYYFYTVCYSSLISGHIHVQLYLCLFVFLFLLFLARFAQMQLDNIVHTRLLP